MSVRRPALAALAALLLGVTLGNAAQAGPSYRLARQVPLPGDEGWDYMTFEQRGHRLFIAHGARVLVVDSEKLTVIGEIPDTPGAHGIALVPEVGRGYVSAGRSNTVVVFDLKTLTRLKEIKSTGEGPDGILYDPATHRVFAFNGGSHNATAIDVTSDSVVGTVALEGRPESAAADGKGHVFVDLEDRNSVALIDAKALSVSAVWPIAGCEEPAGLALDVAGQRLFPACHNQVMAAMDANTGRVLGTAPIGHGVDFAAYDPGARLAFASCGEGVLTAVTLNASGLPQVAQSIPTQPGARTMALDERTHRVYLVTANFGPPPAATAEHPHPRPSIVPETFRLLVVDPHANAMTMSGDKGQP